jgi:pilus assembly protein Flp/PilA
MSLFNEFETVAAALYHRQVRWIFGGKIMAIFKKIFADEAGATAIEYGLIAALIAVAAITAMQGLGNELKETFTTVSTSLDNANNV